jgi:hypothetical protein
MRLGRGPREVYRVYGEDEAPDVDEWSEEAPTRELVVERSWPDAPTCETETEIPAPPSEEQRFPGRPHARLARARRVAVMTLLGVGVGLVAALAIHGLRGPAGVDGRRAGMAGPAGAAPLPPTSPPASVATAPTGAHTPRTHTASAEGTGHERHPATSAELGGAARSRHPHGVAEGHAAKEAQAVRSQARTRAHLGWSASVSDVSVSADGACCRGSASEAVLRVQPAAQAAASEFTFER